MSTAKLWSRCGVAPEDPHTAAGSRNCVLKPWEQTMTSDAPDPQGSLPHLHK
jgi:hypothetical protein